MPDGTEIALEHNQPLPESLHAYPSLYALANIEMNGSQGGQEPPSIRAMQELEMVDYEPASDKGHFRFYPKGNLVKELLHDWAEMIALERLQAYPIETPILYRADEPDIKGQAESFHERHYSVYGADNDERFILRFAGDFGLFRMMKDAQLTYRHLPVRMYEYSPSFRYEQSGELTGLRRVRGFHMPDIHSFCASLDQGIDEYQELFKSYTDLANGTGVHYGIAFRVVESFYQEHGSSILEMLKYASAPALIESLSEMKHYWCMKHEINTIDNTQGICQVSTVQLDIKDASLYGINYVTPEGSLRGCTIVHSSIGSPERWIFSILEHALREKPYQLPMWLAPVQIRIIPISEEKFLQPSVKLAMELRKAEIRADIDDRAESLSWRIRAAEKREWIPAIVVLGEKELAGNFLSVRIRGQEKVVQMGVEHLCSAIKHETKDMPFRQLPWLLISKRPVFRASN
ncbi:MAG: His/Gly/Thr/Pro-type tRNA ligase C-terminal domain-containing protein [Patescibacteria group bacterium]|nr:His/Gly/Thr/Pro-type tRNA ligase C-terminal domain-containing protein [Patescibacteria group bacterium]